MKFSPPHNHGKRWPTRTIRVVENMIESGATRKTIASYLEVSPTTVNRHFGEKLRSRKASEPRDPRDVRIWSAAERNLVSLVSALGQTQASIAGLLGMDLREFQTVFADELRFAKARLDAAMGATIVRHALAGDTQLLKFYARARMKWNDRPEPEPDRPSSEADQFKALVGQLDAEGRSAYRLVLEQLGGKSPLSDAGPAEGETTH